MKYLNSFNLSLLFVCGAFICSCSNDSVFDDYDLSIDSQIPMTRSGAEGPEYNSGSNSNSYIPRNTNECFLYALTDLWVASKDDSYFSQPTCTTATNYYESMRNELLADTTYHWNSNEGLLTSEFERFGQEKGLISEYMEFQDSLSMHEWLMEEENRKQVAVLFTTTNYNGNEYGHYAKVKSSNNKKISFSGYNIQNSNTSYSWEGGNIYFDTDYNNNNEPKPGRDWRNQDFWIRGVYLKPTNQ